MGVQVIPQPAMIGFMDALAIIITKAQAEAFQVNLGFSFCFHDTDALLFQRQCQSFHGAAKKGLRMEGCGSWGSAGVHQGGHALQPVSRGRQGTYTPTSSCHPATSSTSLPR